MTDLFTNHLRFADLDAWHAEADELRAHGVVQLVDRSADGFRPFWAVLGLDEVMAVERQPALFTNEPMSVLSREVDVAATVASGAQIRSLVQMDAPDHPKYRRLTADWFKPASMNRLQPRLDELSAEALARLEAAGGSCDFSKDVAVWYPLAVILAILGLPEEDYPRMLKLTQELFGATDDELGRGGTEGLIETILDYFRYFGALTAERREHPTEDLASLIANGRIDGEPLPDMELMSYYVIIAAAGHDTTASVMTGGLQALIDHPDQLERLRADPALLPTAVDEMIRWVSPVRHFTRTAQADTELGGVQIAEGDLVDLVLPRGEPRSVGVREPPPVRRRPGQRRPSRRVRLRRGLLPRRPAGPHGAAHAVPRSGAAPRARRAGRSAVVDEDHVRRRHQVAADPLPAHAGLSAQAATAESMTSSVRPIDTPGHGRRRGVNWHALTAGHQRGGHDGADDRERTAADQRPPGAPLLGHPAEHRRAERRAAHEDAHVQRHHPAADLGRDAHLDERVGGGDHQQRGDRRTAAG